MVYDKYIRAHLLAHEGQLDETIGRLGDGVAYMARQGLGLASQAWNYLLVQVKSKPI